jgi:hypothetical protein
MLDPYEKNVRIEKCKEKNILSVRECFVVSLLSHTVLEYFWNISMND